MLSACTRNNGLGNLTCAVSTPDVSECQSIPTLNKGTLDLKRNGTFTLSGDYVSCFQSSHVQITGRYQHAITPKQIVELELSAETITQEEGEKIEFPRTIAVINLDRKSGQGNFIDIWSTIRMKGLVKQEIIANALQCQPQRQ